VGIVSFADGCAVPGTCFPCGHSYIKEVDVAKLFSSHFTIRLYINIVSIHCYCHFVILTCIGNPTGYARVSHAYRWIQKEICRLSAVPPESCGTRV